MWELVVIGGGAAGFFGALAFADARPQSRVLILERGSAVLGKVKVSGGGRCNVTHAEFDPEQLTGYYPRGSKALRGAFTRFQPRDTVAWFEQHGVALKAEVDGRMFPVTDSSQTVIDCFQTEAARHGIQVQTGAPVEKIAPSGDGFELGLRNGDSFKAKRVLLATGGERGGFQLASSLGHEIIPPVPSLFTFKVSDPRLAGLPGLSVEDVRLRLQTDWGQFEQRGPLLITHWGVSGPAVLKLSAWGARALHQSSYTGTLLVNWYPRENADTVLHTLREVKEKHPKRQASSRDLYGVIPVRLWQRLAQAAGIDAEMSWGDCSKAKLNRFAEELTRGQFHITGKGEFKEEFVTCGGVNLDEVQFKTMESRLVPGLYFSGEVLDIDGVTGGFNFQAAWTTAWIAGNAAAESLD